MLGLALGFALLHAQPAQAHRPNETYIYMQLDGAAFTGRFETRVSDIAPMFELDSDGDGQITDAEFEAGFERIRTELQGSLSFTIDGAPVDITITDYGFYSEDLSDRYAQVRFTVNSAGPIPDMILARYVGALPIQIPGHQVMMLIESNSAIGLQANESYVSIVFSASNPEQELHFGAASAWDTIVLFAYHGVYHILLGFDHLAVLIAVLLPSVLLASAGVWTAQGSLGTGLMRALAWVTIFTAGQAVTLTLGAYGLLDAPRQPVDIAFALSALVFAALNIFVVGRAWMPAALLALGLLHGLGYTAVVEPLGISDVTRISALLGFSLGLQLGQIIVVALVFPVLFVLRDWRLFVPAVLKGGSALIIAAAIYWFAARGLTVLQSLIA